MKRDLVCALEAAVVGCAFKIGRVPRLLLDNPALTREQLRTLYSMGWFRPGSEPPVEMTIIDRDAFDAFREGLGAWLSDYVEEGRIGDGLDVMSRSIDPPLEYYAKGLVRGAATLGSEHVIDLISRWRDGEPLRYQTHILMHNSAANESQPTLALQGLKLEALPKSTPLKVRMNESMLFRGFTEVDMLGKFLITLDAESPSLHQPGVPLKDRRERLVIESKLPGLGDNFQDLCLALSLTCNADVRWRVGWDDFGDLRELCVHAASGYREPGEAQSRFGGPAIEITQAQLGEACEIFGRLRRVSEGTLPIAISRWASSKQAGTGAQAGANPFIDLRDCAGVALRWWWRAEVQGVHMRSASPRARRRRAPSLQARSRQRVRHCLKGHSRWTVGHVESHCAGTASTRTGRLSPGNSEMPGNR